MAKKFFKSLTLGIVVFSVSVLVGYLAYVVTYHYQREKIQERMLAGDFVSAAPVSQQTSPVSEEDTLMVEYYLARLENDDIAIYIISEGQEFFLYKLDVYTGNFPAADLIRLQEGITLKNRQELASFEEDYTS